jgi:prophage tail gpP-like protein
MASSPDPVATITVQGTRYETWSSGSVRLTMDELTNSFEFSWIDDGQGPGICRGDSVQVALDGDIVIDGYVVSTSDDDEANSLTRTATGVSKTIDLLSSANLKRWRKANLGEIAKALCDEHGITCKVLGKTGKPFPFANVERGEFKSDVIARYCTKRGLIPYTVGGDLVIANVGTLEAKTVLERGVNVVRWSRSDSEYERYSDYRYVSQVKPAEHYGDPAIKVYASIKDPGVKRFRPLLVQAESHEVLDLKNRATLERNQRAGRGEQITVIVNEWTDGGRAWRPNTLVRAVNPRLSIEAKLVIVSVTFRLGAEAPREAELVLMHPSTYDSVANYPARKRKAKWT